LPDVVPASGLRRPSAAGITVMAKTRKRFNDNAKKTVKQLQI
jgi:hypothetical protein